MNISETATENKSARPPRIEWWLFALALVWYSWFLTPLPNWNIMSRVSLASSIVLDHKIDIDRYKGLTGDAACLRGHTFSDKPPGLSWLSLPWLTAFSFRLVVEPRNPWQVWLMTLFSVSLPAALLVVLLFRFIFALTRDAASSLAATLAFAFCTLALPYSTLFISHQPAALILFGLFMLGYCVRGKKIDARFFIILCAVFGFLSGQLFATEYQMLPPCAVVGIYFMSNICGKNFKRYFICLASMLAGAALPLGCWFVYNFSVYQKLIGFGYHHECLADFRAGMSAGMGGFSAPSLRTAYQMFLLPVRGLFYVCPFLLLAFPGLWLMFRDRDTRRESVVILFVCVLVTAMSVSVYQPLGGAAMGPRYLIPMLPFLAASVGVFLSRSDASWKPLLAGTAVISAALMFMGTITNPQVPRGIMASMSQHNLPMLLDGYLRPGILSFASGARWLQIAPPVAISIIIFAIIRQCVSSAAKHTQKPRCGFLRTSILFFSSLAVFGALTAWPNYVEGKRFPAMTNLALGDTYMNIGNEVLAEKRFRISYSYYLGIPAGAEAPSFETLCNNLYYKYSADVSAPCLERYLSLHTMDEAATLMLSNAYLKSGRERERLKLLRGAIRLFPSNAQIHAMLGESLFAHGMYAEALEQVEASLRIDPCNAAAKAVRDEAAARGADNRPK